MALKLELHRLSLYTATGESSYDFGPGLNVVNGSYATGKSSMLELIKYGFGAQNAELMPEIRENLVRVILDVTVGVHRIRVSRELGRNQMLATFLDEDDRPEQWSATRVRTRPRAGERLLQMLGVPPTRLARRGTQGSSEPVSFFDLYRYVYLPQNDVSRSVAGHADPFLNRKRKAVFELAYGLANDTVRSLEVQVVVLQQERERTIAESDAVLRFLERSGAPAPDDLSRTESEATGRLNRASERLSQIRSNHGPTAASDDLQLLRDRVSRLRQRAAAVDADLAAARMAVARGEELLAQLHLDRFGASREDIARSTLASLDFVSCPRCHQHVDPGAVDADHCYLCKQSYSSDDVDQRPKIEVLTAQTEETQRLLEEDRASYARGVRQLEETRHDLYAAASALEEQSDPRQVEPKLDAAVDAAREVEIARAELRDVERFRDLWDQCEQLRLDVQEVQVRIDQAQDGLTAERRALEKNFERLDDLSEVFDDEIKGLGMAGYSGAHIDKASYLPVVNGREFADLSVAGARKMLANVAYYMSNLTYALSDTDALMPSLLMIDGPRSSLGNTPEDVRAGERIYYRLGLIAQAYPSAQILLADNGMPDLDTTTKRRLNLITLTYQQPLLKDVLHPGPEGVTTVGSDTVEPGEPGSDDSESSDSESDEH